MKKSGSILTALVGLAAASGVLIAVPPPAEPLGTKPFVRQW